LSLKRGGILEKEIRHDEYVKQLLEERKKEVIKMDPINEINIAKGEGLTSPTNYGSTEEGRLFKEYMDQRNLLELGKANEERKRNLTLRRFFKMKKNHQVEIYSKCGQKALYSEGKVNAIGRDFVMITNLKDRTWIPYHAIESANIPFGIPNYSNTHQHFLYDNDLRKKLLQNFGATVSQREELIQQFHEESLRTNLSRWKNTWVEIKYKENNARIGKVKSTTKENIVLKSLGKVYHVPIKEVEVIKTIRFIKIIRKMIWNR
jgi:hypothetical protein